MQLVMEFLGLGSLMYQKRIVKKLKAIDFFHPLAIEIYMDSSFLRIWWQALRQKKKMEM